MSQDLYQEIIIEEYKRPQNQGSIVDADLVLTGGNSSCGDRVTIYLKINHDQITDIKWQGSGCAISQAAMSVLSQKIMNEQPSLRNIQKFTKAEMLELLGLSEITSGRERCLLMGVKTLQKAEELK